MKKTLTNINKITLLGLVMFLALVGCQPKEEVEPKEKIVYIEVEKVIYVEVEPEVVPDVRLHIKLYGGTLNEVYSEIVTNGILHTHLYRRWDVELSAGDKLDINFHKMSGSNLRLEVDVYDENDVLLERIIIDEDLPIIDWEYINE